MTSNAVEDELRARLVLISLDQVGNWGTFAASHEGEAWVIEGPVSTLVLPDANSLAEFRAKLEAMLG